MADGALLKQMKICCRGTIQKMEARAPGTYRQTKTDNDRQRQTQAKKYTDRETERNDTERQTERRRGKDKDSKTAICIITDGLRQRVNNGRCQRQKNNDGMTQSVR